MYELNIPDDGQFNNNAIPYSIDDSATIDFTFDRVAYHLELQKPNEERIWVFVSFPSPTIHAEELGVPTFSSGVVFKQLLSDVTIESNHPNLTDLGAIDTGVIEFWGSNYGAANGNSVPNADGSSFDFGDIQSTEDTAGYGSMQIHDYEAGETLFSYSAWGYGSGGSGDDLGIGNNPETRVLAGRLLALFLIGVYPANLYMWTHDVGFNGSTFSTQAHILRLIAQLLLIVIALFLSGDLDFTEKSG